MTPEDDDLNADHSREPLPYEDHETQDEVQA